MFVPLQGSLHFHPLAYYLCYFRFFLLSTSRAHDKEKRGVYSTENQLLTENLNKFFDVTKLCSYNFLLWNVIIFCLINTKYLTNSQICSTFIKIMFNLEPYYSILLYLID